MQFAFEDYFRSCFAVPVVYWLFFMFVLIGSSISGVWRLIKQGFHIEILIPMCLGICIGGYLVYLMGGQLLNGGVYLLAERPRNAVELTGSITDITPLKDSEFCNKLSVDYSENKSEDAYETNGVRITVNGVECKSILKGSLEVGDYVKVVYLPRSGYVLSIEEIPPP